MALVVLKPLAAAHGRRAASLTAAKKAVAAE